MRRHSRSCAREKTNPRTDLKIGHYKGARVISDQRSGPKRKADPCKFTNEVQQADKVVLPWEPTDSCHWKSVVRLPGFMKPGNRVGKSLQLWIARHRRSAGN